MLDILYDPKIIFELYIVFVQDIGFSVEYTNASGDKKVSLLYESLLIFHFLNRVCSIRAFSTLLCWCANSIFACFVPFSSFYCSISCIYAGALLVLQLILPYRRYECDQVSARFGCQSMIIWPQVWIILNFHVLLGLLYRVTSARVWLETTNWFGTIHFQLFSKRYGLPLSLWLKLESY